jgi:nicotinamidase-related amidase
MIRYLTGCVVWGLLAAATMPAVADPVTLNIRTQDSEGRAIVTPTALDPAKVGIVVVDMWNWHWSPTAAQRVSAMVPRMDAALRVARDMGMQVFYCPTSAVDFYVGTPQRERATAFPLLPLPPPLQLDAPMPWRGPGCVRQDGHTPNNSGWDGMDPGLSIHPQDLMPNSRQSLYSICNAKGITQLIYMGVHTEVCVMAKDIGVKNMMALGFDCVLARDLTDAHPAYDPAEGLHPDLHTENTIGHFEQNLCGSINMVDELTRAGRWDTSSVFDPVRLCPWGAPDRPHIFDEPFELRITTPWQPGASIRYTTNGREPTTNSPRYTGPLTIAETTTLRVAAFDRSGRAICRPSIGHYAKRIPEPPRPDVFLESLTPTHAVGPGSSGSDASHRAATYVRAPQAGLSNRGQTLLDYRHNEYEKGVGVFAPSQMVYEIDPSYE